MTLRLADLLKPLDDVDFPNGSNHVPIAWGPTEHALWREATSGGGGIRLVLQIVKTCYPTATEADLDSCVTDDGALLIALAAHAGRKVEWVREAIKNFDVAAVAGTPTPAEPTAPSSPKTNGSTSSPRSRKRSVKSGGTSTTANPTASLT